MKHLLLKHADNLFKRFSDGGGEPPVGPPDGGGTGSTSPDPGVSGAPTPVDPQGTTPAPEPVYAGRFKSPQDMEKSYLELEKKLREQGQELGTLRPLAQQVNQLPAMIEQKIQQAIESQKQPLTLEQKREINEQLLEKFNDDPQGFLDNMRQEIFTEVQGAVKKQYEPLEQQIQNFDRQARWNAQVQQVAAKYPDYAEMVPLMQEVIGRHGNTLINDPSGVEIAYFMAKGMRPVQQADPQRLLQDQNFRQQIVQNQEIRNQIIADYLNQIRQGGTPPVVIGGQPAGASPSSTPAQIKTAKDATKASLGLFQKFLGGGT
ncbi:MAG: hypothetical protein PHI12_12175 [Dehalococcoidales bacterium]|nr:hypothetical protein [Dehalococcoidales bacterium]